MNELETALQPGARNAVRTCLNVQPRERVTVITDHACREIAEALVHEIDEVGAERSLFVLEEVAPRPLDGLPGIIAEDMERSGVSIFACQVQTNELKSRMEMTDIVNRRRMRHAHMVNITAQIMCEGMRADYHEIDRISTKVIDIVRKAREIVARTPAGTDIKADLDPGLKWVKTSGLISPDKWGNLPGGEVFTTPGEVNGTFVIDGVVGDWLCDRYGNLKDSPLTVRIVGNRLVDAWSDNRALREDFWRYTHTDENSDRVGEFAIGFNPHITRPMKDILFDEKIAGSIHFTPGNAYDEAFNGNKSQVHWDLVLRMDPEAGGGEIWFDDRLIRKDGRFVLPELEGLNPERLAG